MFTKHFVNFLSSFKTNVVTGNVGHLQDFIFGQAPSEGFCELILKKISSKVKIDNWDIILKDMHELDSLLIAQVVVGKT